MKRLLFQIEVFVACSILIFTVFPFVESLAASTDEIVTAALKILYVNEGSYSSVNANDNGAVSVGKIQWHGNRALSLLKTIVNANRSSAESILGSTLYNEIRTSSNWETRTVTSAEATKLSTLLNTSEGRTAQDNLAFSDVKSYIQHGINLGITNEQALVYFADIENQGGAGASNLVSSQAASTAGGYGAITLDIIHNAAMNTYMGKYPSRRNKTYTYCKSIFINPTPKPLPDGDYRLKNNSNGLFLVVNNGDFSQGRNNVSTYQLIENANEQIWTLTDDSIGYRITPRGNDLCLNAYGEYAKNGDDVGLWQNTAPNHSSQRWNLEEVNGGYVVRNALNASSVLTVASGNNVKLGTYTGAANQIWTIEKYSPPAEQFYLDINLTVDGAAYNSGLEGVTFDVYIGGSKMADNVSDYYGQHPKGKTYTVNDIRVNGCYTNKGSSSYSGTLNTTTTVTIPIATYHRSETIPAVAVTCTDIGYTEGTKCATCGMIISQPQAIYPEGHQWDEGVITKEPNFNEEGERTYTCQVCGKKQVDPTPPLPYLPCDINGDGVVNNKDLTRLMKYLAGENVIVVQAALDVNGDNAVNNKDLTRLMKHLAGEDVSVN